MILIIMMFDMFQAPFMQDTSHSGKTTMNIKVARCAHHSTTAQMMFFLGVATALLAVHIASQSSIASPEDGLAVQSEGGELNLFESIHLYCCQALRLIMDRSALTSLNFDNGSKYNDLF